VQCGELQGLKDHLCFSPVMCVLEVVSKLCWLPELSVLQGDDGMPK
jgi:hypothetical protein